MGFDGRHSYDDAIIPVEQAYDCLCGSMAVLGGIDMDFLCRESAAAVAKRSRDMLAHATRGGYALGSGNSIANYVPMENYLAMIREAWR